jgi:hypothetical protein
MNPARLLRRLGKLLPRFLNDRRGSADLNTYLLLTAAGCTMVGLTAPHLFKSSKTASNTFEKQVEILQRGASGGATGGAASGGGDWNLGDQSGLGQFPGSLRAGGVQLTGSATGAGIQGSNTQLGGAGGSLSVSGSAVGVAVDVSVGPVRASAVVK